MGYTLWENILWANILTYGLTITVGTDISNTGVAGGMGEMATNLVTMSFINMFAIYVRQSLAVTVNDILCWKVTFLKQSFHFTVS